MTLVTITQGTLKGGQSTTESGFGYFEFLGIPYAKPPVGELRFKSPQSPEPWEGVRDATMTDSTTISCQVDFRTGSTVGSEDCLYLNVYTPNLTKPESDLKPVIVVCHGGGYISGNGTLKVESGPDYLIEHDVVIVTINYRLGPLGFLSLDIPEAAGNMGLKDHVKALQWIQNNIDKFSGDTGNVTILGGSAGSAACEYLLLSPLAKGLFHKCILQSGSALNSWAINTPKVSRTLAVMTAQQLGYTGPEDDTNAIYKFLLEASAPKLTGLGLQIAETFASERVFFGFVPTIEQDFGNGEALLTEYPYTVLKEGKFNQVPVIRGFCNREGILASMLKPHVVRGLAENKSFVDHWAYILDDSDITKYKPKLINLYLDNAESEDFAENFFGDLSFVAGIYLAAKLQTKRSPGYLYEFCYSGQLNIFKSMFGLMKDGAAHGDDIGYLLRHIVLAAKVPSETDILVRYRMTKMWTNFAKTGNPTPDSSSELPVQWPAFTNESQQYLIIDKKNTIQANYEPEKMALFESIYDKYKN